MDYDSWKLATPDFEQYNPNEELIAKANDLIAERKQDKRDLINSPIDSGEFINRLDEIIWYNRLIARLEKIKEGIEC